MIQSWISHISVALKSKEIRDRIFFSLVILVVFRFLVTVPVVGIPSDALKTLFQANSFGQTISTISGGVLETASVVAIGLGPYINASIILQLLSSVIPKLEELRKEGSQGRKVISMYTRYLTLPLAILQSFVIYSTLRGFGLIGELDTLNLVAMIATLTGGSMLMMWFGELIAESGLGQGSSYLIFVGIVASIPSIVINNLQTADSVQVVWFFFILIAIAAICIFITQGERKVKVTYSRRVRDAATQENFIPIKLTQFGVLPVIFAVSLLSFPQLIAQFLISRDVSSKVTQYATDTVQFLSNVWVQDIGTFILVLLFSFFYITVVFNTDELAENLQKQGAFIPGIRPGSSTSRYLRSLSFKLTAVGGLFLAVLAILPNILINTGVIHASIMSGTGLLILVGVVLDIKRQIESMVVVRSYDKYL